MDTIDSAKIIKWEELENGQQESFEFSITEDDMSLFAGFSGDKSRIHIDTGYALRNGFKAPVVYGAVIVSRLSYFVGMLLPGDYGLATDWQFNFHHPLYVGDMATFSGEVVHLSPATRNVRLKFSVEVSGRLIVSGGAGSTLLQP